MLNHDRIIELYKTFVWKDLLGTGARDCEGWAWSQSIQISADGLRIWCDPQPTLLHYGAHGIDLLSVTSETCLLTRQYGDARQVDFEVAASLIQVVDTLLQTRNHKISVAADLLLDNLEKDGKFLWKQVIGRD